MTLDGSHKRPSWIRSKPHPSLKLGSIQPPGPPEVLYGRWRVLGLGGWLSFQRIAGSLLEGHRRAIGTRGRKLGLTQSS